MSSARRELVLRSDYEKYRPLMESYSADGFRTVLFGRYEGVPDGQALTEPVIPMGLILLTNPIRRDAPETFRYFAQQGVAIKVISGDNPLTVFADCRGGRHPWCRELCGRFYIGNGGRSAVCGRAVYRIWTGHA